MSATTEVAIRFADLDLYGHVNHAVYLTYLETARTDLLDEVGFGIDRLKQRGVHLVVVDVSVRFVRPAVFGDRLRIETEVVEVRRASSRWRQRIAVDGATIVEATLRAACTDETGRPVAAPPDLVTALSHLGPRGA